MPHCAQIFAFTCAKYAAVCASGKYCTPKTTDCNEVLASINDMSQIDMHQYL